jgi:hypothetical protein
VDGPNLLADEGDAARFHHRSAPALSDAALAAETQKALRAFALAEGQALYLHTDGVGGFCTIAAWLPGYIRYLRAEARHRAGSSR